MLSAVNQLDDPWVLRAPTLMPEPETSAVAAGTPGPSRTVEYVVQPNDSMWMIAKRWFGDPNRWREIASSNPDINPDRLEVGQPSDEELVAKLRRSDPEMADFMQRKLSESSTEEIRVARAALRVPDGAFAVGTVTRLMPSKGNQYLLEAIPSVLSVEPETRFYIVGEGELREELEAQARALGVADRVTFVGFMRDVSVAYAACDLVVFPSLWEGTPLTAFEALAMGRPIVATDCDGLLDILTPDSDARIVPRRDAGALAEAIIALRRDPETRERLGRQARETGATYDIGEFVRKMERLYELMYALSRHTHREGVAKADLSFLARAAHPTGDARS